MLDPKLEEVLAKQYELMHLQGKVDAYETVLELFSQECSEAELIENIRLFKGQAQVQLKLKEASLEQHAIDKDNEE